MSELPVIDERPERCETCRHFCESWQRPTVLFSDRCGEWRGK